MSVALVLRRLYQDEARLARRLERLAERHPAEHEIHHVARDLAAWSKAHLPSIAEAAPPPHDGVPEPETANEPPAHNGLALLHDLWQVHLDAAAVSLGWEMVAQTAQASRDGELLALAQRCHPDTLRQMRWTNAQIKQLSPQILLNS
ncbi:hypothetical protein [Spirillospora sp. CA-294931]|uniref:hypothetical protein n=1 Tax=Spirillospora sp. CA-294931 TaxID=3240042 RepID=UPI003D8A954C